MKKTVLLLNPPGKEKYFRDNYCSPVSRADYYHQPIDLLVQSGFLKEDFEVDILDAIVEDLNNNDVLNQIAKKDYHSILALTGTASWKEDFDLFEQIKFANPKIILALSGNIVLFEHMELFKRYSFLDVALLDFTTDHYKNFLLNNPNESNSLVYRDADKIVKDKGFKAKKSFKYPIPTHHKFKNKLYHLPLSINHPSSVLTSAAGCPFPCEFCVASEINYQYRDIDNMVEELKHLQSIGIKEVLFQDFMFEASKKRTLEFCGKIIASKVNITWYCNCRVDVLDEEMLTKMKNAGCHTILFGVESSDQEALDEQRKGIKITKVKETINLCKKVGIRPFGNFIIGLPGDTEENLLNMGKFAREIGCVNAVFSTLIPDYGTAFRKKAIKANKIVDQLSTFTNSDKSYPEKLAELDPKRLEEIRTKVMVDFYLHPSILFKNLIKIRSTYEFKRKIKQGIALIRNI